MEKAKIKRIVSTFIALIIFVSFTLLASDIFKKRNNVNLYNTSIHFIDCGQGDCELILSNNNVTLIDCGPPSNADDVVNYIQKCGVETINSIIISHPHTDHIGGAASIIDTFDVKNIYIYDYSKENTPDTETYDYFVKNADENNIDIQPLKINSTISAGNFKLKVLAPLNESADLNNDSAVIKATYNDVSALFTGDIETQTEDKLLTKYKNTLDCDILKVAHHGSKSSSSTNFLKTVSPKYAVISCELDNDFSHPSPQTLASLQRLNADIYRTEINGDVILYTNGSKISVVTEKED